MTPDLEKYTTTALRRLFIEETKRFILLLEHSPTEDLREVRENLRHIYELLSVREAREKRILIWGKNSTKVQKK
jgi:predicted ABC-class ATPase